MTSAPRRNARSSAVTSALRPGAVINTRAADMIVSWIKRPARSGAIGRNLPAVTAILILPHHRRRQVGMSEPDAVLGIASQPGDLAMQDHSQHRIGCDELHHKFRQVEKEFVRRFPESIRATRPAMTPGRASSTSDAIRSSRSLKYS